MKKGIVAVLLCVLCISLCGCGEDNQKKQDTQQPEAKVETEKKDETKKEDTQKKDSSEEDTQKEEKTTVSAMIFNITFENLEMDINDFTCKYYVDAEQVGEEKYDGPIDQSKTYVLNIDTSKLNGADSIQLEYIMNGNQKCYGSYLISTGEVYEILISYDSDEKGFNSVLSN